VPTADQRLLLLFGPACLVILAGLASL